MISSKGVAEPKPKFAQYMDPGVHNCVITGVMYGNNERSMWFDVHFINQYEYAHRQRWFCDTQERENGTALSYALESFKHLALNTRKDGKLITEEQLDAIEANNQEELAEKYDQLFTGGEVRLSLSRMNKLNGKSYVQNSYIPFAEDTFVETSQLRFIDKGTSNIKIVSTTNGTAKEVNNLI